jgi:polyhydroxybutyrate depolymerase
MRHPIGRIGLNVSLVLIVHAIGVAAQPAPPAGLSRGKWQVSGVERTGLVAAPAKPAPAGGTPLILAFHGHGGTAAGMVRSFGVHTLWPEALVLYLQGIPTPGRLTDREGRRAGWQSTPGAHGDRDLAFVDSVLAWAKKEYRIDPKRIYAAGHSNGASFTYVLWAARGDQFAAFAPSAAVFGQMVTSAKPKPALIIAGQRDALVPFAAQARTIAAVRRLNQTDTAGVEWSKNAKLYSSKIGADVLAYIHQGAHPMPPDAAALAVRFFKAH